MSRKIFLNLEVALDNLSSEDIDADLALIPLNVDDLIDESELDDEDTATLSVCDVPGLVEVENADKEDSSDLPCLSGDQNPPAKM